MSSTKPIVLHIGDPVKWNLEQYEEFSKDFTVIRPSTEERQRDGFMKALKEKRWGDFHAIFRPFWNTGGEMGRVSSPLSSPTFRTILSTFCRKCADATSAVGPRVDSSGTNIMQDICFSRRRI